MGNKYKKALIGAVFAVLFGLMFLWKIRYGEKPVPPESILTVESDTGSRNSGDSSSEGSDAGREPQKTGIVVYVSGAVKFPGVYELPEGSRVYDALLSAGGLSEDAEEGLINLAEPISDGEMIRFPKKGENTERRAELSDGKIDLNHADKEELMSLPGIGEVKADAIIQYREEQGAFQSIEELMLVSGIGESLFERIRNRVKV